MSINSIIGTVKKNLGLDNPYTRVEFVFNGWLDETISAKFDGDIGTYDDEIRAGRIKPNHPSGLLVIETSGEHPTPVGSRLSLIADLSIISVTELKTYLTELGIKAELSS